MRPVNGPLVLLMCCRAATHLESRQEGLPKVVQPTEWQFLVDCSRIAWDNAIFSAIHDSQKTICCRFHADMLARIFFVQQVSNKRSFALSDCVNPCRAHPITKKKLTVEYWPSSKTIGFASMSESVKGAE